MTFIDWLFGLNNPSIPKGDYLYQPKHLILLAIVVISAIVLTLIFRKKDEKVKLRLLTIASSIFLFFEVSSRIVNLCKADVLTLESIAKIILPMHICSVMVWIFIFAGFFKKQWIINFAVIGGLLATFSFLAYPAVGLNKTYLSFDAFYSIFTHSLGFVTCICLMTLGIVKFDIKKSWITYVCFGIMFLWGVLLDFVIFPGSDYMYITQNPLPIDTIIPYQIVFGILIAIYIFAFYGISNLKQKKVKY